MALAVLAAGCGGDEPPRARQKNPVEKTARPTIETPTPSATPAETVEVPQAARRRSAALPLEQRVGQLFMVGFEGVDLQAPVFAELAGHGWGGILIATTNAADPATASMMAGEALVRARDSRRVEPLIAAEVPGVTGATLQFGPDVDVPIAGGPDPREAAQIALRAVGTRNVVHAMGHFPGQGAASQDPLEGPAQVGLSRADLHQRDLVPFKAVAGRAPVLVVSSASYLVYDPVTPAALLPAITRDLLRGELRFGGVAMSDDLAGLEAATGQGPGPTAVAAIDAGIDLVHVPDPASARTAYAAVLAAVRNGKLDASRVRDAAARVLALKAQLDRATAG